MGLAFKPIDPDDGTSVVWAEFKKDWRRPQADVPVNLHWRESDGFGQLLPRPDTGLIATFYEVEYYTHGEPQAPETTGNDPVPFTSKVINHLAWRADKGVELTNAHWQALLGTEPADVLEIGCGSGATLERLNGMGHRCVGVEPDPAAMAETQRRNVEVYPGIAEDLPKEISTRKFDAVTMLHVLEHCLDPELAVRNAYDLLKPGGSLIIEVPNNNCKGRTFFGKSWLWLDIPRHLNFFTSTSLSAVFEQAGLTDIKVEYRGYNRQFARNWLTQQARVANAHNTPARDDTMSQIFYLLQTFNSPDDQKYDSVRVIAKRPADGSNTT